MSARPSGLEINGIRYGLLPGEESYRDFTEPAMVRDPEIAGSDRPGQTARADQLPWRQDNWSGGEGQAHLDLRSEESPTRYLTSGDIDTRTAGQVKLGPSTTLSLAIGATTTAPHLAVTDGSLFVFYDSIVRELTTAPSTWGGAVTLTGLGDLRGQIAVVGDFMFVAGGSKIFRVDSTPAKNPAADWVNGAGIMPVAANNRLYYVVSSGGNLVLRQVALSPSGSAPFTPTDVYTMAGLTSSNATGLTAVGEKIWIVTQTGNEPPRLHRFTSNSDGTGVGVEKKHLAQGIRLSNRGVPIGDQNNVVFIGGYLEGSGSDPEVPLVLFATDERFEQLVALRPESFNGRVTCIATPTQNEVFVGTSTGAIFRYDMLSGGISQFMTVPASVSSIAFLGGAYYIATWDGTTSNVYATVVSGSRYVTSATITSSRYDFGLPEEVKVLRTVEVHSSPLPAGASISVAVILDDGSTLTTDASGNTMTHSGTGATRSTFTLSDHDTERLFRYMQTATTLTGPNTDTPTLYGVFLTCETTGVQRFLRVLLDLSDETGTDRGTARQATGRLKADGLRTLAANAASNDLTTSRLFRVKPFYATGTGQFPGPSDSDAFTAKLIEYDERLDAPGQGVALLTVKRF